jgi:leucine-rich repeat protein SHOC2
MEGANETFIQSCFGQHFSRLKWLNISSHMTQLPESMRHLVGLTILQLPNCQNLLFIPEFLINMTMLMHLDFYNCSSLTSLPTTIGDLKHLTELLLQRCRNLKELPQTIGNISSLSILDLSYCKSIESLPTTLGDLKHLIELTFRGCENVGELLKPFQASPHYQYWTYLMQVH